MKKRNTKILRHEWHEHYFTLRGTRLAMHKDRTKTNRTLEYIDIDDYTIVCSPNVASGKLNAAWKIMSIRKDRSKEDFAVVGFQLIPQDTKGGVKLRKRKSSVVPSLAGSGDGGSLAGISDGVNGTGKTHHFAVKGEDDLNNWMRELMLAQTLKQKATGAEITVNGRNVGWGG
jgi:hypothetical protein